MWTVTTSPANQNRSTRPYGLTVGPPSNSRVLPALHGAFTEKGCCIDPAVDAALPLNRAELAGAEAVSTLSTEIEPVVIASNRLAALVVAITSPAFRETEV